MDSRYRRVLNSPAVVVFAIIAALVMFSADVRGQPLTWQTVLSERILQDTLKIQAIQRHTIARLSTGHIIVDPATKRATFEVINRGDSVLTVQLSLEFYRVQVDTAGVVTDSAVWPISASAPSLVRWVKGLPNVLTLAAHETKPVTLTVLVPDTASAPEYWARLVVTAPTVGADLWAVEQTVYASLTPDAPPQVVQKPTRGVTIQNVSSARLSYRNPRRAQTTASVTLSEAHATVLPNGAVRTCATFVRTGTVPLLGTLRLALKTAAGGDTLAVAIPFELQTDLRPCFSLDELMLNMPAGSYTVALTFDPERPDVSGPARVAFVPGGATATFVLTPTIGRPSRPPATEGARHPNVALGSVPKRMLVVDLDPEDGPLVMQLRRQVDLAIKQGKRVLVEVGAGWCPPCLTWFRSLSDPLMIDALEDVRVVRVDFDRWGTSFINGPYPMPSTFPLFFVVNRDGTQGTVLDKGRWGSLVEQYGVLDARAMAPAFKAFVAETRAEWVIDRGKR